MIKLFYYYIMKFYKSLGARCLTNYFSTVQNISNTKYKISKLSSLIVSLAPFRKKGLADSKPLNPFLLAAIADRQVEPAYGMTAFESSNSVQGTFTAYPHFSYEKFRYSMFP